LQLFWHKLWWTIFPVAFLTKMKKVLAEGSQGVVIMQQAEKSYLLALHHAEVVNYKWGSSTYTIAVGSPRKDCCSVERVCREW
jgi:programmed cell death protein 4